MHLKYINYPKADITKQKGAIFAFKYLEDEKLQFPHRKFPANNKCAISQVIVGRYLFYYLFS